MKRIFSCLGLTVCVAPLLGASALAGGLPPPPQPPGLEAAQILPGWARPDGTRMAALEIDLAPGWKTYWRQPGDAGVPPDFDFGGSKNLSKIKVHWPAPEVFESAGARTIGYHDQLILPLEITPKDPAKPVDLQAEARFGICDHICVPVNVTLDAHLSGAGAQDARIDAALAAAPKPIDAAAACTTAPESDGMKVTAHLQIPPAIGSETVLFELPNTPVWVSESHSTRQGGTLIATADLVPPNAKPFTLDTQALRITILSDRGAFEIDGCAAPQMTD